LPSPLERMTQAKVAFAIAHSRFENEFSQDELTNLQSNFQKWDKNSSGELELFELHQMYEASGQSVTHAELRAMIAEVDIDASGGINYDEYLTVVLKQKKGILKKGSLGFMGENVDWSQFMAKVAKEHDASKETGKKANLFEKAAVDQENDKLREAKIKKEQELKRAEMEAKRKQKQKEEEIRKKIEEDERIAAEKEAERKIKVQAALKNKFGGKP